VLIQESLVFISQHLLEISRDEIGRDRGVGCLHPTAYRGIASTTDKANRHDNRPVDTGAMISHERLQPTTEGRNIELQERIQSCGTTDHRSAMVDTTIKKKHPNIELRSDRRSEVNDETTGKCHCGHP
jgi:hypothetical protein